MVEKLRSEVKRIVVERMKEDAEQLKKSASVQMDGGVERAKGTFIIRMDDKGSIVTEAVDSIQSQLESYSFDAEEDDMLEYQAEEEKKIRRAFITLLRMTVHLLLALQDERQTSQEVVTDPVKVVDLTGLANDVRTALHKVFNSNKADINVGISRRSIDDVLSSFQVLWPENILPRRYFGQLEQVLQRLATGPAQQPSDGEWDKEKGEKLIQFMRTIRGEFATHLRQFYSKVADRSGLNSAHEPKPNRTPDEL